MVRALRWVVASLVVLCLLSDQAWSQGRERKTGTSRPKREPKPRKEKKEKKEKDDAPPESTGPREAVKSFRRTKKFGGDDQPTTEKKDEDDKTSGGAKVDKKKRDDGTLIPGEPTEIERLAGDPKTTEEMWRVLDRDMRYGLHKEAKRHLTQLLAQPDLNEKALELREKFGSSMLVALTIDPELRKLSQRLVDTANAQAQKKARDQDRIRQFIANLSKSPGERGYAILQLRRAGAFAVPQLLTALADPKADRIAVMDGLINLDASAAPAVAPLLDSGDPALIDLGVELLDQYGASEQAAALWHTAAAKDVPQTVRRHAQEALARLTRCDLGALPASAPMLAKEAERYYQHKANLGAGTSNVEVWMWSANGPKLETMSVSDAEAYFGEKYARQAVELDPANIPARVTLLSLAFDKSYEKSGVDKPLPETKSGVVETGYGAGADLLSRVLNKAIDENRTAVVLGSLQALAATGKTSLLASSPGAPSPFARAVNYPSRRVQFAAATSILGMRPTEYFPFANRVVQTLVRAVDMDSKLKALVVAADTVTGRRRTSVLSASGYESELTLGGKNGFDLAANSAAFDLAIVDAGVHDWKLEDTVANFRTDPRTAGLPIVFLFDEEHRDRAMKVQSQFSKVAALPIGLSVEEFAKGVKLGLGDGNDKPLSAAEKQQHQTQAVEWLHRLARGEFSFIDVRSSAGPLSKLLAHPQHGPHAAATLGNFPSAEVQSKLAGILLSGTMPAANRIAAGLSLARNIQSSSPGLDAATVAKLTEALWKADDKNLRIALARVVGAIGPTDNDVAKLVMQYRSLKPDDLAPAPAPQPADGDADAAPAKKTAAKNSDEAKSADDKPAEGKPAEKKPAKKSKSFFDDN